MIVSDKKAKKILPIFNLALSETIRASLEQNHCEDVARNADGSLWVKYTGQDFEKVGFQSNEEAEDLIATAASLQGANVNFDNPVLETILPDGNRFEGVLPPLIASPVWTIRARSKQIFSLHSYVENGIMTREQYDRIVAAMIERKNILVSGSNGSGKMSLLNALIAHLSMVDAKARLGIIEDTPELRSSLENHLSFLAGPKGSMLRCLKTCLRMRLDRIAVGEVRGREALVMLKAFNTGYPGMATIHANGAKAAKLRLCGLVREAIPNYDATELVNENIHVIVQIDGPTPARQRQISEILEVQ
jgi:type IV secretion system protein TrbB